MLSNPENLSGLGRPGALGNKNSLGITRPAPAAGLPEPVVAPASAVIMGLAPIAAPAPPVCSRGRGDTEWTA